jgi:hypothetical protein
MIEQAPTVEFQRGRKLAEIGGSVGAQGRAASIARYQLLRKEWEY